MNTPQDTPEPMHVLLTGAAGFVGSHMLQRLLRSTNWIVHCPVSFKHHGNPERITEVVNAVDIDTPRLGPEPYVSAWSRVRIEPCDLSLPVGATLRVAWSRCRYIFNVASSSHVDRSILEPGEFIQNNVALQTNILDAARRMPHLIMFLQMSTDEVYGPAHDAHRHVEWETILPSNPYSASKAAQEAIAYSYWRTYDLPIVITNTMNIIGERQDPEKFLPLVIRKLVHGEEIVVHSDAAGVAGSRFYLHAASLADAWLHLVRLYEPAAWGASTLPRYSNGADVPARFNIVGEREIRNDTLVHEVARVLHAAGALRGLLSDPVERSDALIKRVDYHSSRPGHDLRYALDSTKLAETGWRAPMQLADALERTVRWYLANPRWLKTED